MLLLLSPMPSWFIEVLSYLLLNFRICFVVIGSNDIRFQLLKILLVLNKQALSFAYNSVSLCFFIVKA